MRFLRLRRRSGTRSPRMRLLELTVAVRYAASRLGLLANRLRRTYERTKDSRLLELLNNVLYAQTALEILAVRLETLASVGAVTGEALASVREVVRELRGAVGGLQPMLNTLLLDLDNMVAGIAAETGIELPMEEHRGPVGEEVKRILESARAIAEQRLAEMMPQP